MRSMNIMRLERQEIDIITFIQLVQQSSREIRRVVAAGLTWLTVLDLRRPTGSARGRSPQLMGSFTIPLQHVRSIRFDVCRIRLLISPGAIKCTCEAFPSRSSISTTKLVDTMHVPCATHDPSKHTKLQARRSPSLKGRK